MRFCEPVHICLAHDDADDSEEELIAGGILVARNVGMYNLGC